jgi:hypothetical protein
MQQISSYFWHRQSSGITHNVDAFLDFRYQFTVDGIRYDASAVYSLGSNFERIDSPLRKMDLKARCGTLAAKKHGQGQVQF